MTKIKTGADVPDKTDAAEVQPAGAAAATEQQPSEGGAFVRLPDGTLKREKEA